MARRSGQSDRGQTTDPRGPAGAPSALAGPGSAPGSGPGSAPGSGPGSAPGSAAAQSGLARGIVYMIAAMASLTLMDACAKGLGNRGYAPLQIVWARFAVNAAMVAVIYARGPGLRARLRSRQPGMQLARTLCQLGAIITFFLAIRHIGLAEATALADLNPVLVTLGAALFLGERLGPHRILGILAAFAGAMLILRPGLAVFDPAALWALATGVIFAAGVLLTRQVGDDSTATSMLWSALVGSALSSLALPFVWTPVSAADLWLFGALGAAGSAGQWLLIRAFTEGEAGSLAPFGYTGLLFATCWGWMFFDQLPDLFTAAGAAVIAVAGIYVWMRERRAARSY